MAAHFPGESSETSSDKMGYSYTIRASVYAGQWIVGFCTPAGRSGHCVDLFNCPTEEAARTEFARIANVYGWDLTNAIVRVKGR